MQDIIHKHFFASQVKHIYSIVIPERATSFSINVVDAEAARCSGEDARFLIYSPGFESRLGQVPTSCESWTKSTGGPASSLVQATGKWYYRGKRHCSAGSLKRPVGAPITLGERSREGGLMRGSSGETACLADRHSRRGWSFHGNHRGT